MLFANSTRARSGKAPARVTLLDPLPAPITRPLFNIDWAYREGISLEYARLFKREVGAAGDGRADLPPEFAD